MVSFKKGYGVKGREQVWSLVSSSKYKDVYVMGRQIKLIGEGRVAYMEKKSGGWEEDLVNRVSICKAV